MAFKQENIRKLIIITVQRTQMNIKNVVRHFKNIGLKRSTIYSVLNRYRKKISCSRLSGSGRKSTLSSPRKIKALKLVTIGKRGISYRDLTRKFNCSPNTAKKKLLDNGVIQKR